MFGARWIPKPLTQAATRCEFCERPRIGGWRLLATRLHRWLSAVLKAKAILVILQRRKWTLATRHGGRGAGGRPAGRNEARVPSSRARACLAARCARLTRPCRPLASHVRGGAQACRASKVKCDVERQPSGVCGRCCRLGLQCLQPPPAKRGRPVKLAAARVEPNALGPEPHPLPLPHDPPAPDLDALASHKHLHTEPAAALASTLDKISISPCVAHRHACLPRSPSARAALTPRSPPPRAPPLGRCRRSPQLRATATVV